MTTTTKPTQYRLTAADLRAINRVRTLLLDGFLDYPQTAEDGLLYGAAEAARDALFTLLNHAKHSGEMDIPDDVLHNRA